MEALYEHVRVVEEARLRRCRSAGQSSRISEYAAVARLPSLAGRVFLFINFLLPILSY